MPVNIQFDRHAVTEFCRRNRVRRLAFFGSVLTDRFRPDSDVDVLVEFEPEAAVSLLGLARMEIELSEILARQVDLRTPQDLSRYFRNDVLRAAETLYAA